MFALFTALALAAPPAERPPAVALATTLAESLAAVVPSIMVTSDRSVTAEERGQVVSALERTGLFAVVGDGAVARLELSRANPQTMTAEVEGRDGKRLWRREFVWLQNPAATPPALDPETRRGRIAMWREQRVRILASERLYLHAPFSDPQGADFYSSSSGLSREPAEWQMSYAGSPPVSALPPDWVIVRGDSEVIDDVRLAELLEDRDLAQRIEAERTIPRLWWIGGFSAGAVAGITSGALLLTNDDRDVRTLGVSLLTAGAVAAVLALASPWLDDREHVLTAAEAKTLARLHNDRLRARLELEPDDVEP